MKRFEEKTKKKYEVTIDITMAATLEVDADNFRQAQELAESKVANDPWAYARGANSCVNIEVVETIKK